MRKLKANGLSTSSMYVIWYNMILRCTNKEQMYYKDYGGRGIKVCNRWRRSFIDFCTDMGERPSKEYSLDRINNNGNYEPGNCRWATKVEQANNARSNRIVCYRGEKLTVAMLARKTGIDAKRIYRRLSQGMTLDKALLDKNLVYYKPYCNKGHLYTPETTHTNNRGHKRCITCWNHRKALA